MTNCPNCFHEIREVNYTKTQKSTGKTLSRDRGLYFFYDNAHVPDYEFSCIHCGKLLARSWVDIHEILTNKTSVAIKPSLELVSQRVETL